MVAALLATTVCAVPVRMSGSSTRVERASAIQPRNPVSQTTVNNSHRQTTILIISQRLIPETEHYLDDILNMLTGESSTPDATPTSSSSNTPMQTSTPSTKKEPAEPVNSQAQASKVQTPKPSPSPTTSADSVSFTTTIKSEDTKPIQNIQIGAGWNGKKRIEASDVPVIMNAVYQDIADRFNDMIDSSDEVGLKK